MNFICYSVCFAFGYLLEAKIEPYLDKKIKEIKEKRKW